MSHPPAAIPGRISKRAVVFSTPRLRTALMGAALVLGAPFVALAQDSEGSTSAAVGGAALGAFSGAALGLMGGLEPCDRSLHGTRCARMSTALGGAVGLVSGAVMGAGDSDALDDRFRGGAWGAAIGAAVGYGLKLGIRQYGWPDVAAGAALGAAVGAAPKGTGIGFLAGAAVGGVLWLSAPGFQLPEMLGLSLVGAAVGGLVDWVIGAANAGGDGITLTVPLMVGF